MKLIAIVILLTLCVLSAGCASAPRPLATGKLKIYRTKTGFVTITEIEGYQMETEWNVYQTWTNEDPESE